MGMWVSKHIAGAQLVERPLRLQPEEELQQHVCVEIPAPNPQEASDIGSPAVERHDIVNTQQRYEEPRNVSRQPPLPLDNEGEERELKTGRKFAYWSGSIAFAGAMGIIGARAGNLAVNIKKVPFYTCSTSVASAFIISILLSIFTRVCPALKNSTRIIKFT